MDFLYGQLRAEAFAVYNGVESTTTSVFIDNDNKTISVDVKTLPYASLAALAITNARVDDIISGTTSLPCMSENEINALFATI